MQRVESANILCDAGGEFDCAMRLIKKMPPADKIVFVGDLNDRGMQSKELIEWCMAHPEVEVLHSNHGDMLVEMWRLICDVRNCSFVYHPDDFFNNGGLSTLKSYIGNENFSTRESFTQIPKDHIEWLASRPVFYELPGLIVSHAPIPNNHWKGKMDQKDYRDVVTYIWNRNYPYKQPGLFQVFGHNSSWGVRKFEDWAICIDSTKKNKMTGLHWPTKELFEEPFKEET